MSQAAKKSMVLSDSSDPSLRDLELENRRVLVVEDEPEIGTAYEEILSRAKVMAPPAAKSSRGTVASIRQEIGGVRRPPPFEVTVCRSATEALAKVKEAVAAGKPFAMGFFDVLLNDTIDGIELVKIVFELDPQMFAVFVTAYHDRTVDNIHEVLGEQASERWDYLNKPFTEGEILQKARNMVTVWNLKEDRQLKNDQLVDATRQLMISDRASSVAAVARSVGHEFGNILLQISGTAELNQNADPLKMAKALKTILNASDTASKILEKFKDLSKPATAQVQFDKVTLKDVIDEAKELMAHQFEKQNIRFCIIKQDKSVLKASRTSLVQVFVNMFINATHVMPQGGQIDIAWETIGDHVEIRIRDYGPGIPPEALSQIFDPFFTTKGDKGTGLGLAICREIVEIEHAGEIAARNHGIKGAEFVIQLPLVPVVGGE